MKKWSALLLAAFVFSIGPSVISAEELEKPDKPKGLLTSVLSLLTQTLETQSSTVTVPNDLNADQKQKGINDASKTAPTPVANTIQQNSNGVHTLDGSNNPTTASGSVSNGVKNTASNQPVLEKTQTPVKTDETKPQINAENPKPVETDNTGDFSTSSQYSQQVDSKAGSDETLLNAGVSLPVIGTANLGLLSRSGLLTLDLKGSILGDTHLGVAEVTTFESGDYQETYFGLINADIVNPILGEDHIGVLEIRQIQTDEGILVSGGLVIVDLNNSPLGDAHIGVGEFNTSDTATSSTPPKNPEGPLQGDPSSSGNLARPPNSNKTVIGQGSRSGNEKSSKQSSSFDESAVSDDRPAPTADLSEGVADTGNKAELNHQTEKDLELLKKINDPSLNDSTNSAIQLALSETATSGTSSSSGSGSGSSSGSGGSGADSFLDSEYNTELVVKTNTQMILQEMADEWIKAPPIKPPQAAFFLS